MSSTDNAIRTARCTNVPDCPKALAAESLEWYPGAGEYCPECGESLTPGGAPANAGVVRPPMPVAAAEPPATVAAPAAAGASAPSIDDRLVRAARSPRPARPTAGRRRVWLAAGACLAVMLVVAIVYARRAVLAIDRAPAGVLGVCAVPSAKALAAEIVRAYAAKSATPASRFVVADADTCDVTFSSVGQTRDAVIARDGIVVVVNPLNPIARISEPQLRAIYSGKIRDWSQLGGAPGAIIPILPERDSDEAKALAASLFFDVTLDPGVRRRGSSADVTRAVTGADGSARASIGLATFSQAVPAKVVPLAYWPPPSVLSIATRRYPYTLAIGVEASPAARTPAAQGLVDYARSSDGAAIVQKNGFIPREGL